MTLLELTFFPSLMTYSNPGYLAPFFPPPPANNVTCCMILVSRAFICTSTSPSSCKHRKKTCIVNVLSYLVLSRRSRPVQYMESSGDSWQGKSLLATSVLTTSVGSRTGSAGSGAWLGGRLTRLMEKYWVICDPVGVQPSSVLHACAFCGCVGFSTQHTWAHVMYAQC